VTHADRTSELPRGTGDGIWLEEYLVYDREGFPVGRVFAVLEHEGRGWLGVEREPLPTRHDRRAVPFEQIGEIDHENVAVHLMLDTDEIESAIQLAPGSETLPDELPPRRDPGRSLLPAATLMVVLALLALWAVFVLWASSKSPEVLPYLTVPGALLGAAAFLGYPAWSRR